MRGSAWFVLWLALGALGCAASQTPQPGRHPPEVWRAEELYRSGVALLEQGELTRAEQYLASALRAGYDARAAMRALLTATIRASRLRSALSYAEPYLVEHPRDVPLRLLVGSLHLALGDLRRAEQELQTVLRMREESAEGHYLMAVVLERRGAELVQRNAHFARYLALAPTGRHGEEARAALEQR